MRYFLDTEYDGFGGRLISLALVGESGGDEFYVVIDGEPVRDAWVERHVMPFLDMVPDSMKAPHLSRADAAEAVIFGVEEIAHGAGCGRSRRAGLARYLIAGGT